MANKNAEVKEVKEVKEVATMDALAGLSSGMTSITTLENGNTAVNYVNAKGEECTAVLADAGKALNVRSLVRFEELRKLGTFAVCYELHLADKSRLWEDLGFKSLGQFAESFAGIASKTASQYVKIGRLFMQASGDGNGRKYDFVSPLLKGASVANLNQCLSLVEDETPEAVQKFVKDYVESGVIPITSTLAQVKKALAKVNASPEVIATDDNPKEIASAPADAEKGAEKDAGKDAEKEAVTVEERKAVLDGALSTVRKQLLALLGKSEAKRIDGVLAEVIRMYDAVK